MESKKGKSMGIIITSMKCLAFASRKCFSFRINKQDRNLR